MHIYILKVIIQKCKQKAIYTCVLPVWKGLTQEKSVIYMYMCKNFCCMQWTELCNNTNSKKRHINLQNSFTKNHFKHSRKAYKKNGIITVKV